MTVTNCTVFWVFLLSSSNLLFRFAKFLWRSCCNILKKVNGMEDDRHSHQLHAISLFKSLSSFPSGTEKKPLGSKAAIQTTIYLQLTNSSQITKNAGLFLQKFQWPRKESQACLTFLVLSISSVTSEVLSYTFIFSIPNKENISFYGF